MGYDKGAGLEMKIEINNLSCRLGSRHVLKNLSLTAVSGELLCVIGPNGSGKTTLLRSILGLIKPVSGSIRIGGISSENLSVKQRSGLTAYIPQTHNPPFAFRVMDVVLMARIKNSGLFSGPSKNDLLKTEEALELLNLTQLKNTPYTELSGGEKQLVLIARALAQEPQFMIMDEPTNNLDYGNQMLVLGKATELAGNGLGIIMSTHTLPHVSDLADRVAVLKEGRLVYDGMPENIITDDFLRDLFDVDQKNLKVPDRRLSISGVSND